MPTPRKNQTLTLKIEALTAEGSGVGRSEGFAVFVRGGVPGDEVEAHVIKAKKHYAVAKVTRVLSASPHRIPNDCPLFPRCGGCALRELEYGFEAEEKQRRVEDAFRRLAHMEVPCEEILTPAAAERYRNSAISGRLCGQKGADRLLRPALAPRDRLYGLPFAACGICRDRAGVPHIFRRI